MTVCDLKVGQKGIIDNIYGNEKLVKVGNDETPTMTDLNKVLYKYKSGQSTKVTVNRSGKEVTVDIKF